MANIADIVELLRAGKFPEGFLAVGKDESESYLVALYGLTGLNIGFKKTFFPREPGGKLVEVELRQTGDRRPLYYPLVLRNGGMIVGNGEHTRAIERAMTGKSILESLDDVDYSSYSDNSFRIGAYLSKNESVIARVCSAIGLASKKWEIPLVAGKYSFISASTNEPLTVGLKSDAKVLTPAGAARILYSALNRADSDGVGILAVYKGIEQTNGILFAIRDPDGLKS